MPSFVVDDAAGWKELAGSGLPDSGVTPGTYGDATHVGQFTVDVHGVVTAASNVAVSGGGGTVGMLGKTTITSGFTTNSNTAVQITGFTVTVSEPAGANIKITVSASQLYNLVAGNYAELSVWDGTVGSGTKLADCVVMSALASQVVPGSFVFVRASSNGSKTYNVGLSNAGAGQTAGIVATATEPALVLVEAI